MRNKKRYGRFFFLFLVIGIFFVSALSSFQEETGKTESGIQAEQVQDKITSGPKNITESVGIYIFLGWMWLSIVIFIIFLKLKVDEADRLHHLKYYSVKK
jgi:hypothetical protein